jgi:hypothetical protein
MSGAPPRRSVRRGGIPTLVSRAATPLGPVNTTGTGALTLRVMLPPG